MIHIKLTISSLFFRFDDTFEAERIEQVPVCLVKLVLELDPVKTERVQETFHQVHAHQHCESDVREHEEADHNRYDVAVVDGTEQGFFEENFGQLCVRERQGPKT